MEVLPLPGAAGIGEPVAGPRIFQVNWHFPTQLEEPREFHINWGVKKELLTGRAVKPRDVTGAWLGLFGFCRKILTPISAPHVLFSTRVWKHQKCGDGSCVNTENKLYRDRNVKYGAITESQDGGKGHGVQPGTDPHLVTQTRIQSFLGHLQGWPLQTSLSPSKAWLPFPGWNSSSRLELLPSHSSNQESNLDCRISNLESRISNLKSRISNLGSWISNLRSRISNLESRIANLESQTSNLKSLISNLKSQISNLKS